MTLGELRKLTKDLPDNFEVEVVEDVTQPGDHFMTFDNFEVEDLDIAHSDRVIRLFLKKD